MSAVEEIAKFPLWLQRDTLVAFLHGRAATWRRLATLYRTRVTSSQWLQHSDTRIRERARVASWLRSLSKADPELPLAEAARRLEATIPSDWPAEVAK